MAKRKIEGWEHLDCNRKNKQHYWIDYERGGSKSICEDWYIDGWLRGAKFQKEPNEQIDCKKCTKALAKMKEENKNEVK